MNWIQSSLTWPNSAQTIQTSAEAVTSQVGTAMSEAEERLTALEGDANFGRHSLNSEAQALLGLRDDLSDLLVNGTVLSATPYQFQVGDKLDSGRYLSPENAVKTLVAKMRDFADTHRPKGQLNVVAVMLTAQSIEQFSSQLQAITSVLTLPEWCQTARLVKALTGNEQTKLHQPTAIVQPRFKPLATLNAQPLGDYFSEQNSQIATLESLASDSTNVIGKLQTLAAKRTNTLADVSQAINALKAVQGSVYSMQFSGSAESVATQLHNASLPNNHQLTIASLLISQQPLTFWEELLCSP